ncbi:hypothetical protein [Streptomyces sp. NBC_01451]|uniref:hypothetical protein n=1 Tax=Streptomyces sp. NBC_01451 TaxID=2903872 RepID=UPI002E2EEF25|nr:hypothetical protein [Streptomyces sp. NBC_01451]
MSSGAILNLTAIAISITAVITSVWFGLRQLRISREANHIPVIAELLGGFRDVDLCDHYVYVCTKLREEHSPDLGISGLPRPARKAIYDIAYFLQTFAGMSSLGIVKEEQVVAMLHRRISRAWSAMKPYVEKEREVGAAGPYLMVLLEEFAARTDGDGDQAVQALLERTRNGQTSHLI